MAKMVEGLAGPFTLWREELKATWSRAALISSFALLTGCVDIPEAEQQTQDVLVLVHATERLKVEGLRLGAEVSVDVVRRQDGQSANNVEIRGDSKGLVEIRQAGGKIFLKGLMAGDATITLDEQPWRIEIAEPNPDRSLRTSVRWPGVIEVDPVRVIAADKVHVLFNGVSAQGTRLWGWINEDQARVSTESTKYDVKLEEHHITLTITSKEMFTNENIEFQADDIKASSTFTYDESRIPKSIELLQDGDGAWVVARDANGQLFNTTAWSEPKLDSGCARLVMFDEDNPKDYFSGTLPADESVFRIQRSSPGAGVKDCEVTFSVKHKDVAERLTISGTVKL